MSDQLFTAPLVQSIGWALVHFIWQGALIAGIAAVLLGGLRGLQSAARYGIACAALALMLAAPIATTFHLSSASLPDDASPAPAQYSAVPISTATGAIGEELNGVTPVPGRVDVEAAVGGAVLAWLVGVLFLSLRLLTGWIGVERLRRQARPLSDSLEAQVAELCARLRITRSVRVLESAAIVVPTLVGWIRPVILLPVGVIVGLPPAHLDAVLAHELAHVRRHDYAVNVLQAIVETLCFYHPAVWWCSRQVRIEREHCCDDLAVEAFGDRLEYATALTNLEEMRRNDFRLALAANDGQLLDRVRRLLGAPPAHDGRTNVWVPAVVVAITVALAAAATTMAGAESRQNLDSPGDVILAAERSDLRDALIHLTAQIAAWRGHLFSPQILVFPPTPPRAPEPPAAPQMERLASPGTPEPPAPAEPPAPFEPLAPPAPPAPPELPGPASPEPIEPPEPPGPPEPVEPLTLLAPPAPPQVPAPPLPPAPPAPPAPPFDGRNRSSWTDDGIQTTLDIQGRVTLSDDDRDLASISPGGYFIVEERSARGSRLLNLLTGDRRSIELRGRADGSIDRRYFVGGDEQRFEPEGARWLRELLPRLVRRSGFAAESRVARILKQNGAAGVAREIGLLETDFVRSLYARLLARQATLSASDLSNVLQALQISSDFEMAQALIAIAETQVIGGPATTSYFRAARTIDSDFEMRRALSALLPRPRDAAFVRELYVVSENIDSDFEQAEFLEAAAINGFIDLAPAEFFDALSHVNSDFEHRKVLTAALRQARSGETARLMLQSAGRISGDFEQAEFLRAAAKAGLAETGRDAFFGAVATIGSDFEHRRALGAVVERDNVPVETLETVLRAATQIGSDFEQAELLLSMVRRHRIDGRLRERMLDVLETMGSQHERGRVLEAALRSERAAR